MTDCSASSGCRFISSDVMFNESAMARRRAGITNCARDVHCSSPALRYALERARLLLHRSSQSQPTQKRHSCAAEKKRNKSHATQLYGGCTVA
jgi:hypothetical protein